MANRRRRTELAAEQVMEATLATRKLVETINAAIADGVIDIGEQRTLDQLTARALAEGRESHQAAEQAASADRVAHMILCGDLDTDYLQQQTRDAGFDPEAINALVRETAAA